MDTGMKCGPISHQLVQIEASLVAYSSRIYQSPDLHGIRLPHTIDHKRLEDLLQHQRGES